MTIAASSRVDRHWLWPLLTLNFFMADMQAGIGPFLGVFLAAHGWATGMIGTVMTVGGVAGMIMTTPAGALVDATRHKRAYVVGPGIFTVLASGLILLSQHFWVVTASQVATAIAGAAIGPAVNGITLGIVRQAGFNRQLGRNQAFNHAGNMVGAGLSGLLGWKFGLPAVLWLAALFGVFSIASVVMIPRGSIDDNAARGLKDGGTQNETASGLRVLFECRPLLVLAASLTFFHLGNAAMLPLYGLAVAGSHQTDPAMAVGLTIVVAQGVMIVAALAAMRLVARHGYWIVLLISFAALPVRAVVAAAFIGAWGIYPVQFLDGIGAGRINVGQGTVMTLQALGASLSPAIGGWIAQALGYPPMFLILGGFALISIVLWLIFPTPRRAAGPA